MRAAEGQVKQLRDTSSRRDPRKLNRYRATRRVNGQSTTEVSYKETPLASGYDLSTW